MHHGHERAPTAQLTADLANGLSRFLQVPVVGRWDVVDLSVGPDRGATNSAQRVAAGSAAAFTAAAADAVSYQWFKDGTALPGSTGATLTLGTVSTGHAGVYLVQAINAAGRTTSDPAVLEVTAGPWTDSDGDGAPDSIERLLGLNAAQPAAADSTNATLRLRIHQP